MGGSRGKGKGLKSSSPYPPHDKLILHCIIIYHQTFFFFWGGGGGGDCALLDMDSGRLTQLIPVAEYVKTTLFQIECGNNHPGLGSP